MRKSNGLTRERMKGLTRKELDEDYKKFIAACIKNYDEWFPNSKLKGKDVYKKETN